MKPICIDLFCGLGGWSEAFLAEGYRCIGYDIEAHDYGTGGYPGELVLRDVRSIHGSEFKDATVIVASPPCQEYSYRAMPWSRAKALPPPDNTLFNECFRIQREASVASGHYIPLIVENVRGAQKWVGRAAWHYGSFYLWGDVPALMPIGFKWKAEGQNWNAFKENGTVSPHWRMQGEKPKGTRLWQDGVKVGNASARTFSERPSLAERDSSLDPNNFYHGVKQSGLSGTRENGKGDKWFEKGAARHGSRSTARKAASAMIAKIPFPLAQHIARTYKPHSIGIVESA
jgi:C-5 cytosine-specific DNA methylase